MDCCGVGGMLGLFKARNAVNEQITLVSNTFNEEQQQPTREPTYFEKVEDWWEDVTTKKQRREKEAALSKSRENREKIRNKYNYKKKEEKSGCNQQ
jgi:hypothetical protein